jgi:hypothetical protein
LGTFIVIGHAFFAMGAEAFSWKTMVTDRTLFGVGGVSMQVAFSEAAQFLRETLGVQLRELERESPDALLSVNNHAAVLSTQVALSEPAWIPRETLGVQQGELGREHLAARLSATNLLSALLDRGEPSEAAWICRENAEAAGLPWETIGVPKRVLGTEHPEVFLSENDLANVLSGRGTFPEAARILRETQEAQTWGLGVDHQDGMLSSATHLAAALSALVAISEAARIGDHGVGRADAGREGWGGLSRPRTALRNGRPWGGGPRIPRRIGLLAGLWRGSRAPAQIGRLSGPAKIRRGWSDGQWSASRAPAKIRRLVGHCALGRPPGLVSDRWKGG